MKYRQRLTLKKLEEAGQVKYKKTSIKIISGIKATFLRSKNQDSPTSKNIHPRARFLSFYIWRVYFPMLPWNSFLDILNKVGEDNVIQSRIHGRDRIRKSVNGGIFGIAISAIVASVAAAASKAAAAAATTAAVIGSSTAASTVASSIVGGVGGALAGAATEAIIKHNS